MTTQEGGASCGERGAQSPAGMRIQFENVDKSFREKEVLQDLSFTASAGGCIALVGRSAAGQATLERLLNGMHTPPSVSIAVLGTSPAECSRRELQRLRTRVGFIFQQFGLVGRVAALENVLMGALSQLKAPRYGIISYPRALRERAVE